MDNDPLEDASRLLDAAQRAESGWADAYDGPEGVALEAERLREVTSDAVTQLITVRSAAIAQLLEDESLRTVEKRIGLSRSTINKAHRAWVHDQGLLEAALAEDKGTNAPWLANIAPFHRLTTEESW